LGTQALAGLYQDLVDGRADRDTLARVREINATLPTSFCGLGKAAPTEFLTLQRYWPEVLEAHINGKGCPVCHG
jgi:NADH-quinone oxidoreductase subunit F